MIDKATVQKIKNTADIVEVVSDYVHLTRRGANYMGLCPFHNERTPSFSVNRRRNFCFCFSCKKGGSPVNFIMEKEGISYHDALLQLAKKYGIKVEERELSDEEKEARTERESLIVANEWAMKQFEDNLRKTDEGRDVGLQYLYSRGVTEEAIKAFHLGYAIDNGSHLTPLMLKAGFELDTLQKLGLTGINGAGSKYDKFRGRVIFPVLNTTGKVVAFGGRDLKGGPAKYINSPESTLYKKSNELYGIFQAKSEMVRSNNCFLVEGYLDVIGMWQSGLTNVVASSGTALTDGQIALIHRFTDRVTLIYDGDGAGVKAALRGMDMLLSHKMKVKVVLLPDGEDPDSFARKHSPEEFRAYIKQNEKDVIRFKIDVLLKESAGDPQQRTIAVNSVIQTIANIPDDPERSIYIGECSRLMNIDEGTVSAAVERARYSIIQDRKKRRELNKYPDNEISVNSSTETIATSVQDSAIARSIAEKTLKEFQPLRPLEERLMELTIKNAFLPAYNLTTEEKLENMEALSVVEFIRDELMADEIVFSVPEFQLLFDSIINLIPEFKSDKMHFENELASRISSKEKEGLESIASKGLSIAEIKKAEAILEEHLNRIKENETYEFARHYAGDILVSHENDIIRNLAISLISEKHILSNLFSQSPQDNHDSDELNTTIIRALNELKGEILNLRISELTLRMSDTNENDSTLSALQMQLLKLMEIRKKLAISIGERIVSPTKK